MSDDGDFLSRWSRRKAQARAGSGLPPGPAQPAPAAAPIEGPDVQGAPVDKRPEDLPPLDSLTPESDFTPFMKPEVDPATRQEALKTLFRSPGFNVMDGLDVYIDDYSKPDPLPAGWLGQLSQFERLGDFAGRLLEETRKAQAKGPEGTPEESQKNIENQQVDSPASPEASHTADRGTPPPPVSE